MYLVILYSKTITSCFKVYMFESVLYMKDQLRNFKVLDYSQSKHNHAATVLSDNSFI